MFPDFPSNYMSYNFTAYINPSCYFWVSHSILTQLTNVYHFLSSELRRMMFFTSGDTRLISRLWIFGCSTLAIHIFYIVTLRTSKKVVWPDTERVIAFMANLQVVGNIPIVQLIRKPMSQVIFTISSKRSISRIWIDFYPYPAWCTNIRYNWSIFVNSGPESILRRKPFVTPKTLCTRMTSLTRRVSPLKVFVAINTLRKWSFCHKNTPFNTRCLLVITQIDSAKRGELNIIPKSFLDNYSSA